MRLVMKFGHKFALGVAIARSGTWEKNGKLILCGRRRVVLEKSDVRFFVLGPFAFLFATPPPGKIWLTHRQKMR